MIKRIQWKIFSLWPRANKRVSRFDMRRFDKYLAEIALDGLEQIISDEYHRTPGKNLYDLQELRRGLIEYVEGRSSEKDWYLTKHRFLSIWNDHLVSDPER